MELPAQVSGGKSVGIAHSTMHCSSSSLAQDTDYLHESSTDAALPGDKVSESADSVREEGLRAFRAGDWRGATDAWSRGLRTLDYILSREDEFDEDKRKEFLTVRQKLKEDLRLRKRIRHVYSFGFLVTFLHSLLLPKCGCIFKVNMVSLL